VRRSPGSSARLVDEVELARTCEVAQEAGRVELVNDPIVEGGGFDQFQRNIRRPGRGACRARRSPSEEIQFVEKLQLQEGPVLFLYGSCTGSSSARNRRPTSCPRTLPTTSLPHPFWPCVVTRWELLVICRSPLLVTIEETLGFAAPSHLSTRSHDSGCTGSGGARRKNESRPSTGGDLTSDQTPEQTENDEQSTPTSADEYGSLTVEDNPDGTVDPADLDGTAEESDDEMVYQPEHSEQDLKG
jgi:hypothetical protein